MVRENETLIYSAFEDMSMAHINFDLLTESFLFSDKGLEDFFIKYTDEQLR